MSWLIDDSAFDMLNCTTFIVDRMPRRWLRTENRLTEVIDFYVDTLGFTTGLDGTCDAVVEDPTQDHRV